MSNATLSRRTFATGLAAVGLAAASLALTGCGEDKTAMDDAAVRAAEACAVYIRDGADRAMSRFN